MSKSDNGIERISILPGLFRERMELNRRYLKELDDRCLLQNYYLEAGEIMDGLQVIADPSAARLHWGWESPTCQLRGHFLGHWLSAAAALVSSDGDRELEIRVLHIVDELARLQALNGNGWVAPIPEKYFDILMTDRYIWSPQYTMHKLLMGLSHVYEWMGYEKALTVLNGLADWYLVWTARAQEAAKDSGRSAVYAGEQAGMLEIWARLYRLTSDERYRTLAERYEDNSVYEILDRDGDPLTDNHANASIPLAHGACEMYELTGDEKWRRRALRFWEVAVTRRGMFPTTGANSGEFWIPMGKEAQFISRTDQEFCTVYNMVRLASALYRWTGDTVYADYIERALYNGFLAQQSRVSGMPTYFLPMLPGSRKKWGTKRNDFWCCFGTMIQAQTLYPSLIYRVAESGDVIEVGQYIPSEATFAIGGHQVLIRQTTDMKNYSNQAFFDEHGGGALSRWSLQFSVKKEDGAGLSLAFRIPCWCRKTPVVTVNGEAFDENGVKGMCAGGYLRIALEKEETDIRLFFESALVFEALPDEPELGAVLSGPIVLAALSDTEEIFDTDVAASLKPRMTHTYSTFPWEQDHYVSSGAGGSTEFIPLYEVEDEAYTIYQRERLAHEGGAV